MALTCNIDRRGRIMRAAAGCACLASALLLGLWGPESAGAMRWVGVGVLAGLGLFGLFEARQGWCAVRALGLKTLL